MACSALDSPILRGKEIRPKTWSVQKLGRLLGEAEQGEHDRRCCSVDWDFVAVYIRRNQILNASTLLPLKPFGVSNLANFF
jgi:hypothetical protein